MSKGGSNRALTAEEVAEDLRISIDTLYRKDTDWKMPFFYVGRQWRILERNYEAWLEERQKAA